MISKESRDNLERIWADSDAADALRREDIDRCIAATGDLPAWARWADDAVGVSVGHCFLEWPERDADLVLACAFYEYLRPMTPDIAACLRDRVEAAAVGAARHILAEDEDFEEYDEVQWW